MEGERNFSFRKILWGSVYFVCRVGRFSVYAWGRMTLLTIDNGDWAIGIVFLLTSVLVEGGRNFSFGKILWSSV